MSSSLAKIETQAESLQKLNARWMDRLTRYITEERKSPSDDAVSQLITILSQVPQTIVATLTQVSPGGSNEKLIDEMYSAYIALYFYTACTNYWSQSYIPEAAQFDDANGFHQLCKRVVDVSHADFTHMARILSKCDQSRLKANSISHLLTEAQDFWRFHVRSTADVFVSREKA